MELKRLKTELKKKFDKEVSIEEAVFQVAKEHLLLLNSERRDWETVKAMVNVTQYFAREFYKVSLLRETNLKIAKRIWKIVSSLNSKSS